MPFYQVRGTARPFAAIFKGSYNNSNIKYSKEGETEVAIIEKVETIENTRYGIKTGSVYKLIIIMPSCSKIKSASAVNLVTILQLGNVSEKHYTFKSVIFFWKHNTRNFKNHGFGDPRYTDAAICRCTYTPSN